MDYQKIRISGFVGHVSGGFPEKILAPENPSPIHGLADIRSKNGLIHGLNGRSGVNGRSGAKPVANKSAGNPSRTEQSISLPFAFNTAYSCDASVGIPANLEMPFRMAST